jgi:hypothetical protein
VGVEVLLECGRRPGAVGGVVGFLPGEAFDVDRDGGQHVLDVGFVQAVVAAAAHLVAVDAFADRALDARSGGVQALPLWGVLGGAVAGLQFVQVLGGS